MSSRTVKACIVSEPGGSPEVTDIVLPDVGHTDVRIRIVAVGVCRSDLSMYDGTLAPQFPVVLGHEASGVVLETGSAVTSPAVGDEVVVNWATPCRECWFCGRSEPWLCSAAEGVISTPAGTLLDGTKVHGCLGIGAMAEELVLPAVAAMPAPPGVELTDAALLGCAVLTGVGAATNAAQIRAGDSVAVFGVGGVGLSAIAGARIRGASTVIAIDRSPEKEELARAAGATDFLVAEDRINRAIRGLTEGRGVDHALDCVAHPATIRQAWSSTRRGGSVFLVGIGPKDQQVSFNPLELFHFSRTLGSSVYGNTDPARDLPTLGALVRAGDLDIAGMVTHRLPLDQAPQAFKRMIRGEGGRQLLQV